jgi:hypothetical protein
MFFLAVYTERNYGQNCVYQLLFRMCYKLIEQVVRCLRNFW